jgi:hypothetical protein
VHDVFFGGARGGGKSAGLLGDWLVHADPHGKHARGILIRKSYPELEELEQQALGMFPRFGAYYMQSKKLWLHPSGWQLRLRYLEAESDAAKYQGHQYTWIGVDELTAWPSLRGLDSLRACLRSAHGVPTVFRATGNPGGPGHNLVKRRYIDPAPPNTPFTACGQCDVRYHGDTQPACSCEPPSRVRRVYYPSRLEHNPSLASDPHYWERVVAAAAGNAGLIKAWREGLWDIVAGGYFDDLWDPSRHVVAPFSVPAGWQVDRCFDWGSSAPYAVLWCAESNGEDVTLPNGTRRSFPRGTIFIVAEQYGWSGRPNEGVRLSNTEMARRILDQERALGWGLAGRVQAGPADSAIFAVMNGTSIAAEMAGAGLRWTESSKGGGSRIAGWTAIRTRLAAALKHPPEEPGLFVWDTCRELIRTLPTLSRDPKRPDDVDTGAEDHCGDALRYRLTSEQRRFGESGLWGI